MRNVLCDIYRCRKKEGMYVYVPKTSAVDQLPQALIQRTGRLEHAMTLLLTPEKKLARAKASDVMIAFENQGFYLQMPPSSLDAEADDVHKAIGEANDFLER